MAFISKIKKNNVEYLVLGTLTINPINICAVETNAVEVIGEDSVPCVRLSLTSGQYFIWEHNTEQADEVIKFFTK